MNKIKQLRINHPELGDITVNTAIPREVKEIVGGIAPDYSNHIEFYHALIRKTKDNTFYLEKLSVIKPEGIHIGWMDNSKGNKNFITIITNRLIGGDIEIYQPSIMSVVYE